MHQRALVVDEHIFVDIWDLLAPGELHECPDPIVQRIHRKVFLGHPQLVVDSRVFAD
jgi:hypothetical protein